ncbi:MAG: FHA domain-containing protein [Deltaproteobacteria bacterium]|nr:MAG: FHA domain-containing protein [Deltaproteobacteria bacterium]
MAEVTRTVLAPPADEAVRLRTFRVETLDGATVAPSRGRVLVVGAGPEADLGLPTDGAVSRRHAVVEGDERGYRLRDLASKNGTWVGRVRIGECWLTDGMVFRVGRTDLRFVLTDDELEVVFSAGDRFGALIGASRAMREVFGLLGRVAATDATLLVEGESGTGKELVAHAVHAASPRADGPFVVFDCSAVSRELLESELFGHVRGAFTGAASDRRGAFEEARGGTLFIDEVGELDPDLQPKLLRALERREIRRVGSNAVQEVDVRIVAATNRTLLEEVRSGRFREDLYYRLAVLSVRLPPLRERPDDIPLLVHHFLARSAPSPDGTPRTVSWETMEKLRAWDWPGNVRELRNYVERAAILSEGSRLETRFLRPDGTRAAAGVHAATDLSDQPGSGRDPGLEDEGTSADRSLDAHLRVDIGIPFKDAKNALIDAFERTYWTTLLRRTGGNVSRAARMADMHRKSVEYILRKLDIQREDLIDTTDED